MVLRSIAAYPGNQPDAAAPEQIWLVEQDGRRIGPLSLVEVVMAANNHLLRADGRIWRQGLPRWLNVYEIEGLLGAEQHAPPPQHAYFEPPPTEPVYAPAPGPVHYSEPMPVQQLALPAPVQQAAPRPNRDASYTQRMADAIAEQIFVQLQLRNISKRDHLAKNSQLKDWSARAYDGLPGAMRLTISHSVGRKFIEDKIYEVFAFIRASMAASATPATLQAITRDQVPVLAAKIDEAVANAKAGSILGGSWSETVASLWGGGQQQSGGYAQLRRVQAGIGT